MTHFLIKAKNVKVLRPFVIDVLFADQTRKKIDLEAVLEGPLYGSLKNNDLFCKVEVDPETGVVQWPNGADFDPETLYNWERYSKDLAERATEW